MKGTKERIAKLENNKRDIIKYEQRGLALKTHENQTKTKQAETKISLRDLWGVTEVLLFVTLDFQRQEKKGQNWKNIWRINGWECTNLAKDSSLQIQAII